MPLSLERFALGLRLLLRLPNVLLPTMPVLVRVKLGLAVRLLLGPIHASRGASEIEYEDEPNGACQNNPSSTGGLVLADARTTP